MIIKTFTKPTNVLIIGAYLEGYESNMITDDFISFTTRIGNKDIDTESDGFFNILTEEEFCSFLFNDKIENPYEDGGIYEDCSKILLKNYIGNIEAKAFDCDNETIEYEIPDMSEIFRSVTHENNLKDHPNFVLVCNNTDYKEFIYDEDKDEFQEYCDIIKITHNREKKIDEILK